MSATLLTPNELDGLRPTAFRFVIDRLPKVTYFCQAANIPEIALGSTLQTTPLVDIPVAGEKLRFGDLVLKFWIQEDMANYKEIFDWMVALGFPINHSQHENYFPYNRKSDAAEYSDASLFVMAGNNTPAVQFRYKNLFPVSLSALEFDVSTGSTTYLTAVAHFKYTTFDFTNTPSTS